MSKVTLNTNDISFMRVADLYLKKYREGNAPSVEVFAQAFPHLADEIRDELPAMIMLESALGDSIQTPQVSSMQQLGNCVIETEIGRGGMGTVFRARQQELDRTVAIKVIALQKSSANLIERFELERRAMAKLDHPNIVPVYEYGHDDRFAFLVMKYIEGFNLSQLIDEFSTYRAKVKLAEIHSDWSLLAKWGADVASGLHHAHEQGLIHRDIKPSNLLLDQHDRIWITDFGLAKLDNHIRALSKAGDAIGTPRYMAPEQLRGSCDARSDVYSLGLTLYEIAIGDKAWGEESLVTSFATNTALQLVNVRDKNPCVPPSLADIIMKACEFSPEDRYQSASELEIVLRRCAEGFPVGDRRKRTRMTDEAYRRRQNKNRFALGCLAAAASASAYGYFTQQKTIATAPIAAAPVPAVVQPRVAASQISLIDKLADDERSESMVKIVADFVKESVDEASTELNLSQENKINLISQIDEITNTVKAKGLDQESMDSMLENYRRSTLPIGTKIIRLISVVERSTLTPQEKEVATLILQRFAAHAVKRNIDGDEAQTLVNALTHGRSYTADEILTFTAPDKKLRQWFAGIERRLSVLPPETTEDLSIQTELKRVFDSVYGEERPRP